MVKVSFLGQSWFFFNALLMNWVLWVLILISHGNVLVFQLFLFEFSLSSNGFCGSLLFVQWVCMPGFIQDG